MSAAKRERVRGHCVRAPLRAPIRGRRSRATLPRERAHGHRARAPLRAPIRGSRSRATLPRERWRDVLAAPLVCDVARGGAARKHGTVPATTSLGLGMPYGYVEECEELLVLGDPDKKPLEYPDTEAQVHHVVPMNDKRSCSWGQTEQERRGHFACAQPAFHKQQPSRGRGEEAQQRKGVHAVRLHMVVRNHPRGRLVFDRDAIVHAALRAYVEAIVANLPNSLSFAVSASPDWTGNIQRGAFYNGNGSGDYDVVAWNEAGVVGLAYELGFGPLQQLGLSVDAVTGGPDDVRGALPGLPDELEPALVMAVGMLGVGPSMGSGMRASASGFTVIAPPARSLMTRRPPAPTG